jgi:hypothetical protein
MSVCQSRQCTMRDSPNTCYSSFLSGLFTITHYYLEINSRKSFGSIRANFRKWFSNRNAPTRAYIDEPRPRRRSSSLAGKIKHPSYPCLLKWICVPWVCHTHTDTHTQRHTHTSILSVGVYMWVVTFFWFLRLCCCLSSPAPYCSARAFGHTCVCCVLDRCPTHNHSPHAWCRKERSLSLQCIPPEPPACMLTQV